MAVSIQNLIQERKFPFAFSLFFLLISASLLLLTNDQYLSYFNFTTLDLQSSHSPPSPSILPQISTPVPAADTAPPRAHHLSDSAAAKNATVSSGFDDVTSLDWRACKGSVAADYIPCLDNAMAIKKLKSRRRMEHRERHCPKPSPRCLAPLPPGYKVPVPWPKSRDMVRLIT